jgi:predicted transcriptional regulator of viral defense system
VPRKDSWDRLFETAAQQDGIFSAEQAAAAGYSRQLLSHYARSGRVLRMRRGTYRLVHFRAEGRQTRFVEVWLWSGRQGIFSYRTALGLHGLIDLATWPIYLAVPVCWRARRLRVPADVVLRYDDVPQWDRARCGVVPATSLRRTLTDGAISGAMPEEVRAVFERARLSGKVEPADLAYLERLLSFSERSLHSGRATF